MNVKQPDMNRLSVYCWKHLGTQGARAKTLPFSPGELDPINYCALELLEQMGKCSPTANEIALVELMLKRLSHRLIQRKVSKQAM